MIILVTEWDAKRKCEVVSHGVEEETGRNVVLPWNPPSYFNAVWDDKAGYWILPADKEKRPLKEF
jgi:hypothetical protein